ncbi:hypothetical protein K438DRAFT_1767955 [Mycena galopus ATCC 62051]|nr:hypothetical protein K438DRAFT_1767955 [Mycena galopus ATCC 62051]
MEFPNSRYNSTALYKLYVNSHIYCDFIAATALYELYLAKQPEPPLVSGGWASNCPVPTTWQSWLRVPSQLPLWSEDTARGPHATLWGSGAARLSNMSPPTLFIENIQVINMFNDFLLSLSPQHYSSASFASLPISRLSQPLRLTARDFTQWQTKMVVFVRPLRGAAYTPFCERDFAACAEEMLPPEGKNSCIRAPPMRGCLIPLSGAHCEGLHYHKTRKWSYLCAPRPSTWLASILREDFTAEEQHRRIRLLKQNADDEHGVPTVLPPRKRGGHASRQRRRSVRGQEDAHLGDERRAREEAGQSATEGRARLEENAASTHHGMCWVEELERVRLEEERLASKRRATSETERIGAEEATIAKENAEKALRIPHVFGFCAVYHGVARLENSPQLPMHKVLPPFPSFLHPTQQVAGKCVYPQAGVHRTETQSWAKQGIYRQASTVPYIGLEIKSRTKKYKTRQSTLAKSEKWRRGTPRNILDLFKGAPWMKPIIFAVAVTARTRLYETYTRVAVLKQTQVNNPLWNQDRPQPTRALGLEELTGEESTFDPKRHEPQLRPPDPAAIIFELPAGQADAGLGSRPAQSSTPSPDLLRDISIHQIDLHSPSLACLRWRPLLRHGVRRRELRETRNAPLRRFSTFEEDGRDAEVTKSHTLLVAHVHHRRSTKPQHSRGARRPAISANFGQNEGRSRSSSASASASGYEYDHASAPTSSGPGSASDSGLASAYTSFSTLEWPEIPADRR